jgi:hypothetical protein
VFAYALRKALEGKDELVLLASPADVVLGPRPLAQPDLFVARKRPGQFLKLWSEVRVPVQAIEVAIAGHRRRGPRRQAADLPARGSPSPGSWT